MKKIISVIVVALMATQANAQANAKINCPGGQYDKDGNCIFATKPPSAAKKGGRWGDKWGFFTAEAGYVFSSNKTNSKESKPLFAADGYSAALGYRWGDRWGLGFKAAYTGGKTNEKGLQNFAQTLVGNQYTYKIAGNKTNWSQVSLAAGPSVIVGKKYKGEIFVMGGVSVPKSRSIIIDKYDAQTKVGTVYSTAGKKVVPFWEVGVRYYLVKFGKGTGLGLKGSYGSNGGTAGLSIAISDRWGDRWGLGYK